MEYLLITKWDNVFAHLGNVNTKYDRIYIHNGINELNIKSNSDCVFINTKHKKAYKGKLLNITGFDSQRIYFNAELLTELDYLTEFDKYKSGWYILKNDDLNNIKDISITDSQDNNFEELIVKILEIIKDYREDEKLISSDRIRNWINQFEENDRVFVLKEMKNILSKRYISKEKGKKYLINNLELLAKEFGFKHIEDFLAECYFIDHQPEGKSQKELLGCLKEILRTEYSIDYTNIKHKQNKYYIYVDDVLCTGDTLFKALAKNQDSSKGWFFKCDSSGKLNYDIFKENNGVFILAYFAVHKHNINKVQKRIYYALNKKDFTFYYTFEDEMNIENDISNDNSKLNFLFPSEKVKNDLVLKCQKQIEEKMRKSEFYKGDRIIYRNSKTPKNETLFSSPENRERFEKIILEKSIQIYNFSKELMEKPRAKPLGYGLYTDVSFGFGALIFSWRNVPFNTPLVFWYPYHGWIPLFERKFITYDRHEAIQEVNLEDDYGEF